MPSGEVESELKVVKERREEIDGVLQSVRDVAKHEGIGNFAPLFEMLATENTREGAKWLRAAAVLASATAIAAGDIESLDRSSPASSC